MRGSGYLSEAITQRFINEEDLPDLVPHGNIMVYLCSVLLHMCPAPWRILLITQQLGAKRVPQHTRFSTNTTVESAS